MAAVRVGEAQSVRLELIELDIELLYIIGGGLDAEVDVVYLPRYALDLLLRRVRVLLSVLLLFKLSLVEVVATLDSNRWVMLFDVLREHG